MSRYTVHPMEQNFQDWDRGRREQRQRYWQALYFMRQEYLSEHTGNYDLTSRPTMHYWAEEKYGFRMGLDGQGNYTQDYEVVEPKKFMLFQIKYWK